MNILVLGKLWANGDRVLALSQLGHNIIYGYTSFSDSRLQLLEPTVTCIPLVRTHLVRQVRYLISKYDIHVIYCVLNQYDGSPEVILELLDGNINFPIVRHYKEHKCVPQYEEQRTLMETDGQIYINEQSLEYFSQVYGVHTWSAHVMDGDMILQKYMKDDFSPKLRIQDNEPHIVVAGSLSMLNDQNDVRQLCVKMNQHRVHAHLYGRYFGEGQEGNMLPNHRATQNAYVRLADTFPYIHLHDYISAEEFTRIWSCYDVGFIHTQLSSQHKRAQFEKMNYPYRYSAYLAAGLPLAVHNNEDYAMTTLVTRHKLGITFHSYDDLAEQLYDNQHMKLLTDNALRQRKEFSFDAHTPHLVDILQRYAKI